LAPEFAAYCWRIHNAGQRSELAATTMRRVFRLNRAAMADEIRIAVLDSLREVLTHAADDDKSMTYESRFSNDFTAVLDEIPSSCTDEELIGLADAIEVTSNLMWTSMSKDFGHSSGEFAHSSRSPCACLTNLQTLQCCMTNASDATTRAFPRASRRFESDCRHLRTISTTTNPHEVDRQALTRPAGGRVGGSPQFNSTVGNRFDGNFDFFDGMIRGL
jgi:hypothetical protein